LDKFGRAVVSPDQKRETDRQIAFGFWQRTIEAAAEPKPEPGQQESPRQQELQSRQLKL